MRPLIGNRSVGGYGRTIFLSLKVVFFSFSKGFPKLTYQLADQDRKRNGHRCLQTCCVVRDTCTDHLANHRLFPGVLFCRLEELVIVEEKD